MGESFGWHVPNDSIRHNTLIHHHRFPTLPGKSWKSTFVLESPGKISWKLRIFYWF